MPHLEARAGGAPHGGRVIELKHGHFFGGDAGGAVGFQRAHIRLADLGLEARFRCLGSIDVDPVACRDFERFVGVPATCRDLFDRRQFADYHLECTEPDADRCPMCGNTGHPPPGWREVTPADVRAAFQEERPDIAFTSSPCKGFSGLLAKKRSTTLRYQALNRLTVRGIRLLVEAYESDPVPLIVFENVPLIASRGRALLDDIRHELEMGGYAVAETVHDCGEIGGLAQHRRRFLLVARHRDRVRPFVYVPPKRRVRGIGEVIGGLPIPVPRVDGAGGPMHRLPTLTWKTALRLALIPAGKDWRALEGMDFGALRLVPRNHGGGPWGVTPWDAPSGTVTSEGRVQNGPFAVADVRAPNAEWGKYTPTPWEEPADAVTGANGTGNGAFAVADVRMRSDFSYGVYRVIRWEEPSKAVSSCSEPGSGGYTVADVRASGVRHNNVFRVHAVEHPAQAVTAGGAPSSGGQAVADGRLFEGLARAGQSQHAQMRVEPWDEPAHVVTSGPHVQSGAPSVADVRVGCKELGGVYETAGHYGVRRWDEPSGAVTAHACHDNGGFSVADPRPPDLNARTDAVIISLDGTWHRPLTTLELAALQGYDPADLVLQPLGGTSHTEWREHIGNRVPPPASQAIAEVFGEALLRHMAGEGWRLDTREVWVRRLMVPLAVTP
jgi:site-specific DNA-cytosine methylase